MGSAVFGRDGELGAVQRFLDGVPSGPSALVLEGSAGIGKTTLWQAATERAAARRYTILACRAAESEAKLSLAALADLLAELADDVLARLPAPQRHALEIALLRRDAHGRLRDPRALATAVRSVLLELAARAPLLVAIDDLQWLDAPSARMLEFAVRRLGTARVGVLASSRAGDPRADRLHVERAVPHERVVRVRIGPLSVAALHEVLQAKLGQVLPVLPLPVLVRIARAADGNPLFALEIARLLLERGIPPPGQPLPVPRSAIYASASTERRRRLHQRLAEVPSALVSGPGTGSANLPGIEVSRQRPHRRCQSHLVVRRRPAATV